MTVSSSAGQPIRVGKTEILVPNAQSFSAYRPDIDGLRALAVLPVVLYHAGVRGFSGGFVGVDVFFVISGYLITGILVRDVASKRHSITEFYRRRVLRIFPALFVMLLVTTVLACLTMLPTEIGRYARSTITAALFSSNIEFYLETDYFGAAASAKPLLHTWSLAVEEQWYILWPLVIAAIGAGRSRLLLGVTTTIVLVSLAACIGLTSSEPAAAFYLLPTRAWELGIGALLAFNTHRLSSKWILEALGLTGVVLILASVKVYTNDTAFPGVAAIAPCAGAALIIYSARSNTFVGRVLSTPVAQYFGKISYSLYLWHWPVIVFAQLGLFLPKTPTVIAGEIILAVVLATLSWRFVERPFRGTTRWSTSGVLRSAGFAIGSMVVSGCAAPTISNYFMRFDEAQLSLARYVDLDGDGLYRRGSCFAVGPTSSLDVAHCLDVQTGKPKVLLVGDSHAAALWPGLSRYTGSYDVLQATATGCVAKLYRKASDARCELIMNRLFDDWLPRNKPDVTLFASRWTTRSIAGLEATLAKPRVKAGHPILIGPLPEYSASLPRLLVFADRRGDPNLVDRARDPSVIEIDEALRKIAMRTGTPYLSMLTLLCPDKRCQAVVSPGVPLQFDSSHLTAEGSETVVEAIVPTIEKVIASTKVRSEKLGTP